MAIMLRCLATALAQGSRCPVVSCTGRFNPSDHVKDHALVGFSYKNISSQTVEKSFQACLNDCRFVSYQMKGTRCELIDKDRHTASSSYVGDFKGYKHFELKQSFSTSKVSQRTNRKKTD